jgi:hypothetical protein
MHSKRGFQRGCRVVRAGIDGFRRHLAMSDRSSTYVSCPCSEGSDTTTPTNPADISPPPRPDSARARSGCKRSGRPNSQPGWNETPRSGAEQCRAAFPEQRRQSGEGEQLRLRCPCSGMEAPTGRNYMDAVTVGMPGDGEVSCRRCGREGEGAAARGRGIRGGAGR